MTVAACLVSVALGAWLAVARDLRLFALVPLWFALRMAFNAVDGMLAREFGQASRLGAYLNELTDVVSDAALYAPFALLPGSDPWLVAAIVVLSVISEMSGIMGLTVGRERRYDGPMGKSDRALVFAVVGLLVALAVPLAAALNWLWAAVIALLAVTIVNRVRHGLGQAE